MCCIEQLRVHSKSSPLRAKIATVEPHLTIGEVAQLSGVPATTLRYYESVGLVSPPARVGGQRRYDTSVIARLEVIDLCKAAEFSLEEIRTLFADELPGRPTSRALAEAKLAQIDARLTTLAEARAIIAWGMQCTCPTIDDCTCGIHTSPTAR